MLPPPPSYQRRRPEQMLLYQSLAAGLSRFLAAAAERGREVPRFVEHELRGYLDCGRLEQGFARVRCGACGLDRLVAFSCKGRGFCPSCCGRRMADTAARLADTVLPDVPHRQWVLSLPPPLRYLLAYDAPLLSWVIRAFTRAVSRWQRHQAKERYGLARVSDAHTGAITAVQRFGSALNLNVHLHTLTPDGVFIAEARPSGESTRFLRIGHPDAAALEDIAWETCVRTLDRLRAEGRWVDEPGDEVGTEDPLALDAPLLSELYATSITGRLCFGDRAGERVMRFAADPATMAHEVGQPAAYGFDVHAAVVAEDASSRERLCRYLLRPPAGVERFSDAGGGRVALRLKRPWSDGTTHVVFTPVELVEKLAALVPPPRVHQLRYHGVFAPRHRLRSHVVPGHPAVGQSSREDASGSQSPCPHRIPWAKLLQRVFDIDVLECPRCKSRMQRIAFITKPSAIRRILEAVGYPADSPGAVAA